MFKFILVGAAVYTVAKMASENATISSALGSNATVRQFAPAALAGVALLAAHKFGQI